MIYSGNCRLGDLFENRREKGRPGLPLLSVTMNDGLVDRDELDRKQESSLAPEDHLLVKPGDIAYNMMRMWQGAFGLAEREALVSPAYVVVKPNDHVDPRYASYLFKTRRMRYLFWAYSYGLTDDRLRLYADDFLRIPVEVPSLSDQRRIGLAVQSWDRAIVVVRALAQAMKRMRRGLALSLLSGSTRLPSFSAAWRSRSIRSMGRIVSGGTPDTEEPGYWSGQIPWATPSDVSASNGRYIVRTGRSITESGLRESAASLLPVGSILVCTRATVGELRIAGTQISTNQGFKSLVPSVDFDSEFLYYLFGLYKKRFVRLACGSTFLELSKRDFERIKFDVPEIAEQRAIALCLNQVDDCVTAFEIYEGQLMDEKSALLDHLL